MTKKSNKGATNPNKKGRTDQGAAAKAQGNNNGSQSPVKPKSQRDLRCLAALAHVDNGVMRHDMDIAVGAQNSPEYISRLRMAGWDIITERVPMIDRDGRKVRVGRYTLAWSQRELAMEVCNDSIKNN